MNPEQWKELSKAERREARRIHREKKKARKKAARCAKILSAAIDDDPECLEYLVRDWRDLARELAADPTTDPAIAQRINDVLRRLAAKRRNNLLRSEKKRKSAAEQFMQKIAAEKERAAQPVRELKDKLPLEEWCLHLALNPDDRALVGVRNRPVKITVAENAVLKAKESEVRSRKYIYRTTVLKRGGWTPELVDAVLGAPDKLVPNPHYKSGPPAMLYWLDRVIAAETNGPNRPESP